MVNGISTEQAIINNVFAELPEVKSKKEHVLKHGDSLWKLAKRELGNKKLSDREIRDYMFLIAKLNGLDTLEKMNNLFVNQKIYLPVDVEKTQKNNQKNSNSKFQNSLQSIINTLKNDKTVYVNKAIFGSHNFGLYHIFHRKKYESGFVSNQSPVLSFQLDKNGKIKDIVFDDKENILPISFDYKVDKNGKTVINKYPYELVENLSNQDKEVLFGEILKHYENYQKQPKRHY